MPDALKKHLAKMSLDAGDFVLMRPPVGATFDQIKGFAREVNEALTERGLGPLIVIPPLVDLRTLGHEELSAMGLCRVIPEVEIGAGALNWEAYEEEAHKLVRLAFVKAKETYMGEWREPWGDDAVCPSTSSHAGASASILDHTRAQWEEHVAQATAAEEAAS